MSIIEILKTRNKPLHFRFGGYDYMDEIKMKLELKKNKLHISYLSQELDNITIKSRIIPRESSFYTKILNELGHMNSTQIIKDTIVIDCVMTDGYYKFPYCFCNYKTNKLLIIKKEVGSMSYKMYEYIKFPYGVFTSRYSSPIIFNTVDFLF